MNISELDKNKFFHALKKTVDNFDGATHGYNCYPYHSIASKALTELGIDNELIIGYAIWRVNGPLSGGVVCHIPYATVEIAPKDVNSLQYHAWLKIGSDIVDFTTHMLRHKSKELDKIDGNDTLVEWCPDYLWEDENNMSLFNTVRDSYHSGVYCYIPDQDLKKIVVESFHDSYDESVKFLLGEYNG